MFSAKRIVLISVLSFLSANALSKTISVTDSTLSGAEAKVAQQAESENASYRGTTPEPPKFPTPTRIQASLSAQPPQDNPAKTKESQVG
ncbi:hypothetical protein ACED16_15320 [Enterobacter hormaechei]